jgi:uncharacterized protein YukJ
MPLKNYGVLKCQAIERKLGEGSTPHYQVLVTDTKVKHRIAINVKSKESPSELLYFVDDKFNHPIIKGLVKLNYGFNQLDSKPGGLALDFIRGNLFAPNQMKPLPYNVPGPDNDLNELLELYIARALKNKDITLYAFGEKWGPEKNKEDKYFHFLPGNGIHDIHMNQGNAGSFQRDNGVWQDGGLLIHYPSRNQWVGIFLAFQSQSFHTDDRTGNRIETLIAPSIAGIRIIAALVNPGSQDTAKNVTLINTSAEKVDLSDWKLADSLKRKQSLSGIINPGEVMQIPLDTNHIQLENDGGIITLLDNNGVKIDGVSYTKEDAQKPDWTIVF